MRRARVEDLAGLDALIVLPSEVAHHLVTVLRLPDGAAVLAFDGKGYECDAELVLDDANQPSVRVLSAARRCAPDQPLHALVAVLKGPAMDLAVRTATEVGATHIHTWLARRSVPKKFKLDRWARIAAEAARQCGRADVPLVQVGTFAETLLRVRDVPDRRIALPGAEVLPGSTAAAAVLVGPEGGFAPSEVDVALEAGFEPFSLGSWVLRASTAVPVALSLTRFTPKP